jgi:general secretion pathway protein D
LLSRRLIRSFIIHLCSIALPAALLAGCSTPTPKLANGHLQAEPALASAHLQAETSSQGSIPEPILQPVPVPKPRASIKPETYSVVVSNIRVQDLLFSLARDAKINIDVHPGITGTVTLNAIDQTLEQLMVRIGKQVNMRYEFDNGTLIVLPDTPFLRTYHLDYLDMARDATNTVAIATQLQTTGGAGTGAGSASTGGGNNSTTRVTNTSKNDFWKSIEKNIKDILAETDKERIVQRRGAVQQEQQAQNAENAAGAAGAGVTIAGNPPAANAATNQNASGGNKDEKEYETLFAASTIVNVESGVVTVRATALQHQKIQEFLDQVMESARRQVLIEVTVVEVDLNQTYQQGINWSRFANGVTSSDISTGSSTSSQPGNGVSFNMTPFGSPPGTPTQGLLSLGYLNPTSRIGAIAASIQLLESFGNVKVLSSPKISVLNNQTALLKVVDNIVYFTITAVPAILLSGSSTAASQTTFTTTVNSVPVGFVMQVTPQIADDDIVMINLRPTISRIISYVNDPNPALAQAGVVSRIPQIQSREMESVLRIPSGQIAVMGGLMQDAINNNADTIPGVASLPVIGKLFQNRNDAATKTELVIFLRAQVIRDASLDGDYRNLKNLLPGKDFMKQQIGPKLPLTTGSGDH